MPRHRIFAELERRHVFRVGAAYAVSAWLILQLASLVFPMFATPPWVMKVVLTLLVLGFPFAIALAWSFDISLARGVNKRAPMQRATKGGHPQPHHLPHPHRRRFDAYRGVAITTAALLVVCAGALFWLWRAGMHRAQPVQVAGTADAKSVAVLPFENLSADSNNAYFAGGMQQEILTRLAGIRALKVISRNSTEDYASKPTDLKKIAAQLGVATVLEGSVQKAAEQVHINVQLIDVASGAHLWADSYDGDLKDMFGVERDVAQKVSDALKAQLLPAEAARLARVPTRDPDAYDLYLRAGYYAWRAWQQDNLVPTEAPLAIALYRQALQRDPDFALAAAALGREQMLMYFGAPDRSDARLVDAKRAIDHALALQPNLGEAHFAMGLYEYWGRLDYDAALGEFDLARHALPNDVDVVSMFAFIARRRGQWNSALEELQHAITLDPRRSDLYVQLGLTHQALRRYAEADVDFTQAVARRDASNVRLDRAGNSLLWKGNLGPLRKELAPIEAGTQEYAVDLINFYTLFWLSREYPQAARAAQADNAAIWPDQSNVELPRALYVAWALRAAGDAAQARTLFTSVRENALAAIESQKDDSQAWLALGFAEAGLDHKPEALRAGEQATRLMPVQRDAYRGPGYLARLAQICVEVGETDRAIALLKQLMAMPAGTILSPATLKLDPTWDPLRRDPRFNALLASSQPS